MLLNSFYLGLSQHSRRLLNKESDTRFVFLKTCDAIKVLYGMLVDDYIYKSIKYARIRDMYNQENYEVEENIPLSAMFGKETLMLTNDKHIEEVKMLSEAREPLLDLDKCSLNELIAILEKFATDPTINVNQAGFGSYIANYVIKEKIQRYNNEAMIPPKLGDVWIPKVLISIDK